MASYTIDDIEAVAGARSYQPGIDSIDRVSDLAAGAGVVTAVVYGSGAYQVRLEVDAGAWSATATARASVQNRSGASASNAANP